MRVDPQHLFDTFGKFNQLSFLGVHQELPLVLDYLKRFAPDCKGLRELPCGAKFFTLICRQPDDIQLVSHTCRASLALVPDHSEKIHS